MGRLPCLQRLSANILPIQSFNSCRRIFFQRECHETESLVFVLSLGSDQDDFLEWAHITEHLLQLNEQKGRNLSATVA